MVFNLISNKWRYLYRDFEDHNHCYWAFYQVNICLCRYYVSICIVAGIIVGLFVWNLPTHTTNKDHVCTWYNISLIKYDLNVTLFFLALWESCHIWQTSVSHFTINHSIWFLFHLTLVKIILLQSVKYLELSCIKKRVSFFLKKINNYIKSKSPLNAPASLWAKSNDYRRMLNNYFELDCYGNIFLQYRYMKYGKCYLKRVSW